MQFKVTSSTTHCRQERPGEAYRRLYDAVAPVLPGPIVVGDLSPHGQMAFMNDFYRSGVPAVRPWALGVHPYDLDWTTEHTEMAAYARRHHVLPIVSEWGRFSKYGPSSWTSGLRKLHEDGYALTMIYESISGSGWDTHMGADDLVAVSSANR